ncbi:cysteine-rich motor neuron 1 protein-like [Ostrea edulis]|uniref:cysteine-rich motor neuron 1 protein-like n=1 Tax=Ostrea edulis TaxID=37623 RepID=UPI0024AF2FE2|nr:cysteine-rich motor neuron 1 protein-like [Ostrea edulis]
MCSCRAILLQIRRSINMCHSSLFVLFVLGIGNYGLTLFVYTPDCPHPCVVNGHHFCYPPPCPPPACDDPVYAPGQCCTVCPDDCPRGACTIGNRTMCYPIPCPLPPCKNPVSTPGECCPHCPQGDQAPVDRDCPHPCVAGGHKYCHPVPCPLPPCQNPVTTLGDCCPHCPESVEDPAVGLRSEDKTRADVDTDCPHPCVAGGHTYCHPVPCPFPPCDEPVTTPGDCCPHCPFG